MLAHERTSPRRPISSAQSACQRAASGPMPAQTSSSTSCSSASALNESPPASDAWLDLAEVRGATEDEGAIRINQYFTEHPEMVLGTHALASGPYGEAYTCLPRVGTDLGEALAAAVLRLPECVYDGEPEAVGPGGRSKRLAARVGPIREVPLRRYEEPGPRARACFRHADHQHARRNVYRAAADGPRGAAQVRGLHEFDAWASTFGDTSTELELQPSGKYRPVTRFAQFVNVPELIAMFRSFADVVLPEDLRGFVKVPSIAGGKHQIITAEPTAGLQGVPAPYSMTFRITAIEERDRAPRAR